MAYIYNIPQATDQLSVSQGQILGNFTALGAIAGNASNSSASINSTAGFNWLYLPPQGAIPPAGSAFAAGNVALYSANNASTTFNELYVNKTTSAGVVQIPITAYANGAIAGNTAVSWTYLPSGMLMIQGQNTTVGGTVTIVFGATANGGLNSFPGFGSFVSSITATRVDNSGSSTTVVRIRTFSLTQVVIGLANGSTDSTFFWTAIGI